MKYKVVVYYDGMEDSEHIFSNKNDAINELHRLRGVKYRNARKLRRWSDGKTRICSRA